MNSPQDVGVREHVSSVLKILLKQDSKYGSDEEYHASHEVRYSKTLEVLLNQNLGSKMLEMGTSSIIPLALNNLIPGLQVDVTHFDLDMPTTGTMPLSLGTFSIETNYMAVDLETMPLPIEDSFYDSVLCSEVLEHLDSDPMYMLSEINRVLKEGGVLVLTTPNVCSTQGVWKILRGYEPYFYMQYHKDGSRYRHNYEYSKRTLKTVLEAAGFQVDIWTENTFEKPVLEDLERLKAAGYDLNLADMGDNLFVVAKKISKVIDRYPSVLYV
jgi:ubiquinone/menaquinone biosynthesis C-methylase UbiE